MVSTLINKVIPQQYIGNQSSTSTTKEYQTLDFAHDQYRTATNRLLTVNEWGLYAGTASASFQLVDVTGTFVNRDAREGDFFQIDIPGPGTKHGDGKDWVQVEKIDSQNSVDEQITYMRVKPASPPFKRGTKEAHFFSSDASSTFLIHRRQMMVTAAVYGRNEVPNTHDATWIDQVRNFVVAIGAFLGFSYVQWKSLVNGFVGR